MSLGLLPTPTVAICQAAKMIFNVAPGNFYLTQYLEYQGENGTSATIEALANLAGGSDEAFVSNVLANLGLADNAGAEAFMDSAIEASGRGGAIEAAIDALSNLAADDAVYGATKTAFDTAVEKSVSYSTNPANDSTDVAVLAAAIAEAGATYTVTADADVEVDAGDMLGLSEIGSVFSDGSVRINDLTTLTDSGEYAGRRDTNDLTIRMDHTGNSGISDEESDLEVYFDQDYIETEQVSETTSNATFFLLDEDADLAGENLLSAINVNGLRFSVDGVEYSVVNEEIGGQENAFDTHATFTEALQAPLQELIDSGVLSADSTLEVNTNLVETTFIDTGVVSSNIPAIQLTVPGSEVEALGFSQIEDALGEYDVFGRLDSDSSTTVTVLRTDTNIVLNKVGRDSDGGDLTVGGMSTDGTNTFDSGSGSKGIQKFNVEVEGDATQPSDLASLQSTNNTLEEVVVTAATGAEASLTVGNSNTAPAVAPNDGDLAIVSENVNYVSGNTVGNNTLNVTTGLNNALKDVQIFNAASFDNNVELHAHFSDEVVDKYINLTDDQTNPAADNVGFAYSFGAGSDTLNVNLDKDNLAAASGTNTREDFSFTATMGAGNDTVQLQIGDSTGAASDNWFANTVENENLTVNLGAGNDSILTYGAGAFDIDAGAGNDVVMTDNSGAMARDENAAAAVDAVLAFNEGRATYVFNSQNTDIDDLLTQPAVSGSNIAETTVTVNFLGLEAEAVVGNTSNVEGGDVSDLSINQAIKDAINNDQFLSDLIVAEDGPSRTLVVRALTDGARDTGNLSISIASEANEAQQADALSQAGELDGALEAALNARFETTTLAQQLSDGVLVNLTGANSDTGANQNTVADGDGEDTIVLSTAANAAETVQLEADNDVDVIVNFAANDSFSFAGDVDFTQAVNNAGATVISVDGEIEAILAETDAAVGAGNAGNGAGGGAANGGATPVAVNAAGNVSAANGDFQYDFADGDYAYEISGFSEGDVLDVSDVNAQFQALVDADQTDGEQGFELPISGDQTVTITLTGLTGEQDAGAFNTASFTDTFGAGSLIV